MAQSSGSSHAPGKAWALVFAMLVGRSRFTTLRLSGAFAPALGWNHSFAQGTTLRFPIYLNLITALFALAVVLGLREPRARAAPVAARDQGHGWVGTTALRLVTNAGTWIVKTPVALCFVITAGVMIDSVVRTFLTFSSSLTSA